MAPCVVNDILVALNNLLQGKFTTFVSDFGRVAINSTLGVGGLFDVATEAGIEKHDEDFGQTLGWWGMEDGPFIMLPFFGPSNARDLVGRVVDYYADPVTYVRPRHVRNIMWGTRIVNRRAELLDASTILETAALDPYEFVRDAYIQRRRNLIYDGSPPPEGADIEPEQPKSRSGRSRDGLYLSSDEPAGEGAILVSGESRTPVRTATGIEVRPPVAQQAVPASAGGTERARPQPFNAVKEPVAVSLAANVPTSAELESLLRSLPTVATARRTARAVFSEPGL